MQKRVFVVGGLHEGLVGLVIVVEGHERVVDVKRVMSLVV